MIIKRTIQALLISISLCSAAAAQQEIKMPMGGGGSAVFRGDKFHSMLMEMDPDTAVSFDSNGRHRISTSMEGIRVPAHQYAPETVSYPTRRSRAHRHHVDTSSVFFWENEPEPPRGVATIPDYTKTPEWNDVLPPILRD